MAYNVRNILIVIFFIISFSNSYGKVNYHFQHYTIEEGLPQNTVHDIIKDSDGWMWFATGNGLARFDGYRFDVYHKPDLPSNLVNAVVESNDNSIWIGTSQGLAYFDKISEKIYSFDLGKKDNKYLHITSLFVDEKENIWVGTLGEGLFIISKNSDEGYDISNLTTVNSDLTGNNVYSFCQLKDSRVLIGTNHGISTYDFQNNSLYPFIFGDLDEATVFSIYESLEGDLWVGTYNGVWLFNAVTGRDEWFFHDPYSPNSLNHGRVNHITQDFRGTIYLGSLGGVNLYQPQINAFSSLPIKDNIEFSLNSMFINVVYPDDNGNVWIGTEKGGVNRFNLYQKPFNHIVRPQNSDVTQTNNTINSILPDNDILWVGTAGEGLNKIDRKNNKSDFFEYNPLDDSSIPGNYVTSLIKDNAGSLWLGTWGGGISKMLANGKFRRFIPLVSDEENNFVNTFVSTFLLVDDLLFVGTEGGLALLDTKTEEFLELDIHSPIAQIREIGWIIKDKDDYIWIASRNGLYYFHKSNLNSSFDVMNPESFVARVKEKSPNNSGLSGNYITTIFEDNDGALWVGTYGDGLTKLTKKPDNQFEFEYFTINDGLCNNVIYSIQQDKSGFIWASTEHGLSRINPEKGTIENFFSNDGLVNDQFYWSASAMSEQGELFFGSINGVNHFFPSSFPLYPENIEVTITKLQALNETVKVGEKRNNKVVLNQAISKTDEISLSYLDNVFSLEFSALDYFGSDKIKYSYMLEGVDRDWVYVSHDQRTATYTNLKGGVYKFKVRATLDKDFTNAKIKSITIQVRPPFWKTKWFVFIIMALTALIAIFYIRHHTRRLTLEKLRLEQMVKERTKKIEEQNRNMKIQSDELQKANDRLKRRGDLIEGQKRELEEKNEEILEQRDRVIELNREIEDITQNRMRFFTNISHEFRTPLTLIISPLDRLLKEVELPELALDMIEVIKRNANRLNVLIDQLLMFRKIETGSLNVKITKVQIDKFVTDVYKAFEVLANERKIKFTLDAEKSPKEGWVDIEKTENILYNILSNAFKFTPDDGEISITLLQKSYLKNGVSSNRLVIEVSDTGIGIDKEEVDKVFNRYYRLHNSTNTKGSGIGLSLTKELMDALGGEIRLKESVTQTGTSFELILPFQKDDFRNAEIIEEINYNLEELESKVELIRDESSVDASFNQVDEVDSEDPSVLLVEDNRELSLFIANSLSADYRILTAADGKEGYELAKKHSPDVIITDVMMPVMNGIEMCKNIKSNIYTSHIPVIMLSAKALVENQIEGVEVGAIDYIPKPFNLELLRAKLNNIVETKKRMREMFSSDTEVETTNDLSPIDEEFIKKSYEVLEQNYLNPNFNVELFSEMMFVSRSLLYKKLKALLDLSPNDFITIYRLKKSLPLLSSKTMSINEVAYSIGFNDPKYFSRVFKKFYKKTPSEYAAN